MSSEYYKSKAYSQTPIIVVYKKFILALRENIERLFFLNKMVEEPNEHIVKKQLRCIISSCFDKNNICCKVCDIKKCRYKCNFINKEICEHQKSD